MHQKLINFLVDLTNSNASDYEVELRSDIDASGYVSFVTNYINPYFIERLEKYGYTLINVSPIPTKKKLSVTIYTK